MMELKWRHF